MNGFPLTPPLSPTADETTVEHDFIVACQKGNLDEIKRLSVSDSTLLDISNPADANCTPLHYAILNRSFQMAEYLLACGANPNRQSLNGSTPLHWAAGYGETALCVLLMHHKAVQYTYDSTGYCPVHLAVQNGFTLTALFLVCASSGSDILQRDGGGRSLLHWAAIQNRLDTVRAFCALAASCDQLAMVLDAVDNDYGMTPLHWAAHRGLFDVCKELLKWGSNPSIVDIKGRLPVDCAAASGFQKYYELALLDNGMVISGGSKTKSKLWLRVDPRKARFWIGKVIPHVYIPYLATTIGYASLKTAPIFVSIPLIVHYLVSFHIMPTLPLLETDLLNTVHWNWYFLDTIIGKPLLSSVLSISLGAAGFYLNKTIKTDPGIISTNTKPRQAICQAAERGQLSSQEFCTTCLSTKPLRSKHCRICNRCVSRFDHHCPWTGSCIGAGNHRYFMLYIYALAIAAILYVYLGFSVLVNFSPNLSSVRPSFLFGLLILILISAVLLLLLATYQTWLIMANLTTNESNNFHRYKYLNGSTSQQSAFNRGALQNCIEFWHSDHLRNTCKENCCNSLV